MDLPDLAELGATLRDIIHGTNGREGRRGRDAAESWTMVVVEFLAHLDGLGWHARPAGIAVLPDGTSVRVEDIEWDHDEVTGAAYATAFLYPDGERG